jgi:hypothetical protein
VQPSVASITHYLREPRPRITTPEAGKESHGTQKSVLNNVLRVLLIVGQPTCEVVGGVKMWQHGLLKIQNLVFLGHGNPTFLRKCGVLSFA